MKHPTAFHFAFLMIISLFPSACLPAPRPTEISDHDPKGNRILMRFIPAGDFRMGTNEKDAMAKCLQFSTDCPEVVLKGEAPEQTIHLDDFYMDKFEVTNKLYLACVDAGICDPPKELSTYSRPDYFGKPEYDNYPVVFVDWFMAKAYCEWREARLPTEAEWEKAARGPEGNTYPWGDGIDNTRASYDGNVKDSMPVGSYEDGKSTYGVYDLAGNVWEWVNSKYASYPYEAADGREDPENDGNTARIYRGGAWNNDANMLRSSYRTAYNPFDTTHNKGFRCAHSLPETSAASKDNN